MLFLDTYAMISLAEDPDYLQEYNTEEGVTLETNLAEIHYVLLRKYGIDVANHFFTVFSNIAKPLPKQLIPSATTWRYQTDRNVSYFDALGYQYAKEHELPFITGNRDFEGLDDAEIRR